MFRRNRRKIWPVFYGILLIVFTAYVGLDTFVIARAASVVPQSEGTEIAAETSSAGASADAEINENVVVQETETLNGDVADTEIETETYTEIVTDTDAETDTEIETSDTNTSVTDQNAGDSYNAENVIDSSGAENVIDSYSDENMSITISEYREYDTTIYVADVSLSSKNYLKTAFAQSSYGRNVTAKTSEIAESVNAILAINGDYYGAQERGYVIRNGVIYRDKAVSGKEDLVIYTDGSFGIINESEISAQELLDAGAVQVLSFGPALIEDGQIAVSAGEEVGKAMASNPRTAIAVTEDGHYLFVVSDGRTNESEGLSLSQMAEFLRSLGVETAYNLDGGGSSTMVFEGEVINNPTTGGSRIKERKVSDIVYIGY